MDGLLRLSEVSKSYVRGDRQLRVMTDVSLTVAQREIVAIVGSRYEGKTTLLRVAAGLDKPERGEVWFEDLELTRCAEQERVRLLGKEITWVDRGGTGVRLQVLDYVGLPLALGRGHGRREARELAMDALERVGVADCARQQWSDLSNWERVLVALARGIAPAPRLMVIDDLLDGLGMNRTRDVSDLLSSVIAELGCGVLLSVSDVEAALEADRVFSFERAKLKLIAGQHDSSARVIAFPGEPRGGRGAGGRH